MLTIKSDDVVGRAKAFEAIVKGTDIPTPKVPESFKVLIKELNALGLNVVPVGATISDKPLDIIEEPQVKIEKQEKVEEEAKELQNELGGGEVITETVKEAKEEGVEIAQSGEREVASEQ
jgi:DNA-directed RNA polymerase subunit beta